MQTKKRKKKKAVEPEKPPLNARLHRIRERIWNATGVASTIEYAADSCLTAKRGKPDLGSTGAALHDLLEGISADLEEIIEDVGGTPEVEDQL